MTLLAIVAVTCLGYAALGLLARWLDPWRDGR